MEAMLSCMVREARTYLLDTLGGLQFRDMDSTAHYEVSSFAIWIRLHIMRSLVSRYDESRRHDIICRLLVVISNETDIQIP